MAQELKLKIPEIHWGSVLEFLADALIVIMAGNLAAKFFLATNVPITEQFTSFLIVLAIVLAVAKFCISTRIVKARA
jgi:hypothetical protein